MLVAPKLRICRSERIPRQPHCCVRPFKPDSEHFRCSPRTCRPLRDTLGALRWHKAGGEARPHVRHETSRVHHAARRRGGGVAARGARAAARAEAADRLSQVDRIGSVAGILRESWLMSVKIFLSIVSDEFRTYRDA